MKKGYLMHGFHRGLDVIQRMDHHDLMGTMIGQYGYSFKEIVRWTKGESQQYWMIYYTENVIETRIARIVFYMFDMLGYFRITSELRVIKVPSNGEEVLKGDLVSVPPSRIKRRKDYFYCGLMNKYWIIIKRRKHD